MAKNTTPVFFNDCVGEQTIFNLLFTFNTNGDWFLFGLALRMLSKQKIQNVDAIF